MFQRETADVLKPNPDLCNSLTHQEWSQESLGIEIRTTIPATSGKQLQYDATLKALALEKKTLEVSSQKVDTRLH